MEIITTFFVFLFGLIIGSFLNVLILRYNTGRSIGGRSGCFSCSKKLSWYELIPVVSFFVQNGRCRGCKSKISWQYPLVEIMTGLIFSLIAWCFWAVPGLVVFYWLLATVSIFIFAYDWRHQIIPDSATVIFIFMAVLRILFFGPGIVDSLLTGLGFFLVFWALWYFSGGRWLGFGDAKLVLAIGLLLGWQQGLVAMCLAFWLGAIVGLVLIAVSRGHRLLKSSHHYTIKSEIPFAPFILIGAWLVILLKINEIFFF
ncbi:MAG: prepilin peptidase [Candidatus Paceibacterota bacterium]|jgi:prepilin signal peptidase PulO-like enzyme (type II secretory pathway)